MSQIYKPLTSSGPIPPIIATSFVTQDGTAVPAANVLIVNGNTSTENNANGVISKGGVVGTGTSNEVDIVLTNRATGSGTTTAAATADIITLALGATPSVYTFDITVSGFAKTGIGAPAGCGYTIVGSVRTTGAAAILIPTQVVDHFEEAILQGPPQPLVILTVSANNAIVRVTGISDGAAGFVIDWNATLSYTFVS